MTRHRPDLRKHPNRDGCDGSNPLSPLRACMCGNLLTRHKRHPSPSSRRFRDVLPTDLAERCARAAERAVDAELGPRGATGRGGVSDTGARVPRCNHRAADLRFYRGLPLTKRVVGAR
jgi:hypothetical protein